MAGRQAPPALAPPPKPAAPLGRSRTAALPPGTTLAHGMARTHSARTVTHAPIPRPWPWGAGAASNTERCRLCGAKTAPVRAGALCVCLTIAGSGRGHTSEQRAVDVVEHGAVDQRVHLSEEAAPGAQHRRHITQQQRQRSGPAAARCTQQRWHAQQPRHERPGRVLHGAGQHVEHHLGLRAGHGGDARELCRLEGGARRRRYPVPHVHHRCTQHGRQPQLDAHTKPRHGQSRRQRCGRADSSTGQCVVKTRVRELALAHTCP